MCKSLTYWTLSPAPAIIFCTINIHLLYQNHIPTIRSLKTRILGILTPFIPVSSLWGVHLIKHFFFSLPLPSPWSTSGFPSSERAGLRWSQGSVPAGHKHSISLQHSSWRKTKHSCHVLLILFFHVNNSQCLLGNKYLIRGWCLPYKYEINAQWEYIEKYKMPPFCCKSYQFYKNMILLIKFN